MSGPTDQDDPVARFFSNWAVYRAVIDNDCMEHRAIYTEVGRILGARTEPFTMLDLGCGDAAGVAPALNATAVARYTGVDNAGPALEFAAETLNGAAFEVELLERDLWQSLRDGQTYDVVLMAFALHHFGSDEKRQILADIHRTLAPGGELLLIDLVRHEGQPRAEYLEAYADYVHTWPLTPETIEAIIAHVLGFDFPEQVGTQPSWALELGYSGVEQFYEGGNGTQRGWRMRA